VDDNADKVGDGVAPGRTWDFRRPWRSRTFWLLVAATLAWLVLLGLLSVVDFKFEKGHSERNFDRWLFGLFIGSATLLLLRYLMLSRFEQAGRATREFFELPDELYRECYAMARYAMERGRTPADADIDVVQTAGRECLKDLDAGRWNADLIARLTKAHKNLSTLVSPAMPKTLVLLSFEDKSDVARSVKAGGGGFAWLGAVRLVRMMLGLAIIMIVLFIALALAVGTRLSTTQGLFSGDFIDKTQTGAYLIVAAALGASFAALFKARRYIENLSYDEQYESSYWMRFVQGVLAGLILSIILSVLLPFKTPDQGDTDSAFQITVPLLALVGGFSSDLVYRILKRVIDAIETLIQGSANELIDAEKQQTEARLKSQAMEADQKLQEQTMAGAFAQAQALMTIRNALPPEPAADGARAAIDGQLQNLFAVA